MKIGIMGLKKSGKTTVFEALTNIVFDPNKHHKDKFLAGIVKVPDSRIDFLSEIFQPKKTTYPEIQFLDYLNIEGNTKSLNSEYIAKLKECDGLLKVIRNFNNDIYPPVLNEVNPLKELEEMDDEMFLNDILAIEKRLEKLKNAKYKLSNVEKNEIKSLEKLYSFVSENKPIYKFELSEDEIRICKNYGLLSAKKEIIFINTENPDDTINDVLKEKLEKEERNYVIVSAENEKELNELDEESKMEFAKEMKINEFGIEKVIKNFYYELNLITFLTMGKDEVKGWTITKGTNAVKAAGKIHSDIERGFIKAQVVSFEDFKKYGSIKECSSNGVLRLEGKDYIVKDGDIIEFKFNV